MSNITTRIVPLTECAVRVTHTPHGQDFPADRPWLKDVLLPQPSAKSNLRIEMPGGLVNIFTPIGLHLFAEAAAPVLGRQRLQPYSYFDIPQTALYAGLRRVDNGIRLTLAIQPGEAFYGWGEWFNAFERKAGQVVLENRNALFSMQEYTTYSTLPFFMSNRGYGFLLLNSHRSRWQIDPQKGTLTIDADGPNADYVVIYGSKYKQILKTYATLTGHPPLLPRWAFGLWVTSYPQGHQEETLELIRSHREKQIPLDAVILDYHWEERFHNFKWRQALIPDPPALVAGLKTLGARLGLILTPFVNTRNRPLQKWLLNTFGHNVTPGVERHDERAQREFAEARLKGLLAHKNVRWWFGTGGMLDFTNPATVIWWNDKLRPLYEQGVDFIKNDDGEDLPDDAQAHNGLDGREYHNLYGLYYGRATYTRGMETGATPTAVEPRPRGLIYARTGWIGSQRYPALFLGDQKAALESIQRTLRAGLNLAMCGFAYWTADIFGLDGPTTPEIHMRYAQWALLSPVARYFVRPEEIDETRFPWSHNEDVETNFRKYTELRYRLLPYFTALAYDSHFTGVPLMRPMTMEFQDSPAMRSVDDQVMLGEALMICPVTETGARSRKIILPEGVWHDFWSERSWIGNIAVEYPAPLNRMPILARGGTILPLGPVLQHIPDDHQFDHIELHIWPPYPAETLLFDDDGRTTAYQQGAFSRTRIRAEKLGRRVSVRISAAQGKFPEQVQERQVDLILHRAGEVESACVNQENVPATSEADFVRVALTCPTHKDTDVEIYFRYE
jgi:alpha-glucosidase (family GH31 glycosyl hydrolase)